MKERNQVRRNSSRPATVSQAQSQAPSRSVVPSQPKPESERLKTLTYAILTVPLAEPGKLPPKADDAVVALAAQLGCEVGLSEVHRQVRRLANAPNPLIRGNGAAWKLTAAGKGEQGELLMHDCARRVAARRNAFAEAMLAIGRQANRAVAMLHHLSTLYGQSVTDVFGLERGEVMAGGTEGIVFDISNGLLKAVDELTAVAKEVL